MAHSSNSTMDDMWMPLEINQNSTCSCKSLFLQRYFEFVTIVNKNRNIIDLKKDPHAINLVTNLYYNLQRVYKICKEKHSSIILCGPCFKVYEFLAVEPCNIRGHNPRVGKIMHEHVFLAELYRWNTCNGHEELVPVNPRMPAS